MFPNFHRLSLAGDTSKNFTEYIDQPLRVEYHQTVGQIRLVFKVENCTAIAQEMQQFLAIFFHFELANFVRNFPEFHSGDVLVSFAG